MEICSHSEYHRSMPTPVKKIRIDDLTWARLEAHAPDGNRSALIHQFINWFLGSPGASLPQRPHDLGSAEIAAEVPDVNPSVVVKQLVDWYLCKPGARLPDRPGKPDADRARENQAVAQFLDWYRRRPGADLPDRPPKR